MEIIEAHYLFNIPYEKLDIKIHPQYYPFIIENRNYVSTMVSFNNDVYTLINFLCLESNNYKYNQKKYKYDQNSDLSFFNLEESEFPIYNYFNKLKKIKINIYFVENQYAVELFKNNKLKYTDIFKFIKKTVSLNL